MCKPVLSEQLIGLPCTLYGTTDALYNHTSQFVLLCSRYNRDDRGVATHIWVPSVVNTVTSSSGAEQQRQDLKEELKYRPLLGLFLMDDNTQPIPDDKTWQITFEGYDPEDEGRREALCTLGNGYLVTRAAAPSATADGVHYPGTYRAGLYNRLVSSVEGEQGENESLVNLPNWLPLTFRIGEGDWFAIDEVHLLSYRQTLDLRCGVLRRDLRFRDPQGRETTLRETCLVSMAQPHLAGLRVELIVENWSGDLEVRSALDGDVVNNLDGDMPNSERHLELLETGTMPAGGVWLKSRTTQSRIEVALAAQTRVWVGSQPVQGETQDGAPVEVAERFRGQVSEGTTVVIEKLAALYTSRDPAISESAEAAQQAVRRASGFEGLLEAHQRAWELLWGRCRVEIGAAEPLLAVRFNLFHILQTASLHTSDLDAGIPSRSWQEGYRGQIFWDELFVFPLLTFRIPALARELLLYRYRRLDEARHLAQKHGYRGAMFPWRSASTGREETPAFQPYPPSGHWLRDDTRLQRHIGAAVAHSVWYYVRATGDSEFMSDYGAELLLEVARFWASIATYNAQLDRFEIHGVVGPDEFHTAYPDAEEPGISNNAYTNLMAVWTLTKALEVLEELTPSRRNELCQLLTLTPEELDHWDEVSRKMYVPFYSDGILNQFEGFERLRELDLDAFQEQHGDTRVDWVLEAKGDSVNNYQVAKQADTVMLFFLLPKAEVTSLLARLGYRFDHAMFRRTVDYHLQRTRHESSLSQIVYAGAFVHLDLAASWKLFEEAQFPDLAAVRSEGAAQGVHLGAMAGTVYLLQHHYLGLSAEKGALRVEPALPEALGSLSMDVRYRHNELRLEATDDQLTVSSAASNAEVIKVISGEQEQQLRPSESVTFDLQKQAIST